MRWTYKGVKGRCVSSRMHESKTMAVPAIHTYRQIGTGWAGWRLGEGRCSFELGDERNLNPLWLLVCHHFSGPHAGFTLGACPLAGHVTNRINHDGRRTGYSVRVRTVRIDCRQIVIKVWERIVKLLTYIEMADSVDVTGLPSYWMLTGHTGWALLFLYVSDLSVSSAWI